MSKPWAPDHAVDDALARRLIGEQHPDLAGLPVTPLAEGWDNSAYLVGDAWLFRFPRRQIAVELMESEIRILPRIAPRLPAAISAPERLGQPTEAFPAPFAGYRFRAGRTGCQAELDALPWDALAGDLGRFLRALHDVPLGDAGDPLPDRFGRTWFERQMRGVREVAEGLVGGPLDAEARAALALVDARLLDLPDPPPPEPTCLVHGDLYGRHLVLDDAGRLAAIIDWGDVHHGDFALDLLAVYAFIPPVAHAAFYAAYGEVDAQAIARARTRALNSAINVLAYGLDKGDAGMLKLGRWGITNLGG